MTTAPFALETPRMIVARHTGERFIWYSIIGTYTSQEVDEDGAVSDRWEYLILTRNVEYADGEVRSEQLDQYKDLPRAQNEALEDCRGFRPKVTALTWGPPQPSGMTTNLEVGGRVKDARGRTGVIVALLPPGLPADEANKRTVRDLLPRVAIVRWDHTGKEERALVKDLLPADPSE